MRGYKARPPIGEHRTIVTLLAVLGLTQHSSCAGRLLAAPATHWAVVPSLPARPGEHVLVTDDTWVGGGHAQSAVLAARQAGAQHVSVLVLARWLNEDYGSNARFLADLASRDFDPQLCPWTGGRCP